MGDAGPIDPPPASQFPSRHPREVTVLVTGFGPFKTFTTNPSHLIALRLPERLHPEPPKSPLTAHRGEGEDVPVIRIITHPHPIRVAYATAATEVPALVAEEQPDYIVHIGMAGGRDYYTLETVASRDGYRIRDVDDMDGSVWGELRWREMGLPSVLEVGWDAGDVLARWKSLLGVRNGVGRLEGKELVRLSGDAGRFLCEFVLFGSLGGREVEARREGSGEVELERRGKVAFLHVPGYTDERSLERGTKVAAAAVRSLVGSWEGGRRRRGVAKHLIA